MASSERLEASSSPSPSIKFPARGSQLAIHAHYADSACSAGTAASPIIAHGDTLYVPLIVTLATLSAAATLTPF